MTTQLIEAPTTDASRQLQIANAVVAAGGDLDLVSEQFTLAGYPLSKLEALEAYMTNAADIKIQDATKAMMMLCFLELLSSLKDNMKMAMANYNPTDLHTTMRMVIDGMAQLLGSGANNNVQPNQINILQQFGGDTVRNKLEMQLEQYRKNDPADILSGDIQLPTT